MRERSFKYLDAQQESQQISIFFKSKFHNEGGVCEKSYFEVFFWQWSHLSFQKISTFTDPPLHIFCLYPQDFWQISDADIFHWIFAQKCVLTQKNTRNFLSDWYSFWKRVLFPWTTFSGRGQNMVRTKFRCLSQKSDFYHWTPSSTALGETVHFPRWERFSDFWCPSYGHFRKKKKKLVDASKSILPPHCTMGLSPLKSCIKEFWLNAFLDPHFPSL